MKDNKVEIIICVLIIISLFFGIVLMLNSPLDSNLKDIIWYSYNINDGTYTKFSIGDNSIIYASNDLENKCTKYVYNSKGKKIVLNCGITIKIKKSNDKYLLLNIDGENKLFFKTIDQTFNKEFYDYFGMSVSEYKEEKKYVEEIAKLNASELSNYIIEDGIFVFKGDKCTSIECTLVDYILEYYLVNNKNTYYIDSNNINEETFKNINLSNIIYDIDYYNNEYPIIMILKDNEIEYHYFKCDGFNCNKYKQYSQK